MNNFVQLILTVCSLAQPVSCDDRRLTFSTDSVSLGQCIMQAQPFIAQWSGDHPTVRVSRWRCALPGASGDRI
jgi:hypothetical protein